jgi:hypothetical protein
VYSTTTSDSRARYIIPAGAFLDQVGTLLADFRSKTEGARRSVFEQRKLAADERLWTRVFEWMLQLEGLDEVHTLSKQFCADFAWPSWPNTTTLHWRYG